MYLLIYSTFAARPLLGETFVMQQEEEYHPLFLQAPPKYEDFDIDPALGALAALIDDESTETTRSDDGLGAHTLKDDDHLDDDIKGALTSHASLAHIAQFDPFSSTRGAGAADLAASGAVEDCDKDEDSSPQLALPDLKYPQQFRPPMPRRQRRGGHAGAERNSSRSTHRPAPYGGAGDGTSAGRRLRPRPTLGQVQICLALTGL